MTDRAQFTTPRWAPAVLIAGTIVMLIGAEVRDQLAAAPFDQVEHVCGLCGADWTPAASLLIIGALVAVVSVVARSVVAPTVFRGGDDE
jgi:hypothetical protein